MQCQFHKCYSINSVLRTWETLLDINTKYSLDDWCKELFVLKYKNKGPYLFKQTYVYECLFKQIRQYIRLEIETCAFILVKWWHEKGWHKMHFCNFSQNIWFSRHEKSHSRKFLFKVDKFKTSNVILHFFWISDFVNFCHNFGHKSS